MKPEQIKVFLEKHLPNKNRTMVVVDFGNVEKWRNGLGWKVGIRELANLSKHFSSGQQYLRRFYYGADYGASEKSTILQDWSRTMLETARNNGFEVINKRVKYIRDASADGFQKKCDLDVEMTVDLIREKDNYDIIVLFSGDGDLMYAIKYLAENFGKRAIVMSARGHIGREVLDAKTNKIIEDILFAEDFEARLNMERMRAGR